MKFLSFVLIMENWNMATTRILLWHLSADVTAVSKHAGWGSYSYTLEYIEHPLVVPSGTL